MIVDGVWGRFSNTTKWVLPDKLFWHAYNNCSLWFGHGLRAEAVRDLKDSKRSHAELVAFQKHAKNLCILSLKGNLNLSRFLEWILKDQHTWGAISNSSWNRLRFHNCWNKTFTFNIVLPLSDLRMAKHNITRFNLIKCGGWVLNLNLDNFVWWQNHFIGLDLKVSWIWVSEIKEKLIWCWVFKFHIMGSHSTQFALKKFKILDWALIGSKWKFIPELTNFFVQETNIAFEETSLKWLKIKLYVLTVFGSSENDWSPRRPSPW